MLKRLKELRLSRKITQPEMAKMLNVGLSTYQRYEYGTLTLGVDLATTLADYYGVSVDYLLGRTDNPATTQGRKERIDIKSDAEMSYQLQLMGINTDHLQSYMDFCAYLKRQG